MKPKKVGLCYFSGTGNTWAIAREYADGFARLGHEVDVLRMEALLRGGPMGALAHYDFLGLGYPVHAWGAPFLVEDFLRALPASQHQNVFLFLTLGGSFGGAFEEARRILGNKGYIIVHEAVYYTGCDYYVSPKARSLTAAEMEEQLAWCSIDAHEAAEEILEGIDRHFFASALERVVLTDIGHRLYLRGARELYRLFRADARCDQCGLCVRTCPTGNIRLGEHGVIFGRRGTLCLRCLGICPKGAIQVGRWTEKIGRYLAPGYGQALVREILFARDAEALQDAEERPEPEMGDAPPA
jgi:ferredoxin/flavodoxin